ncbi:UNVERIFIED_CONTAM: hypothetical protein K2H54_046886 [Gekko kuhli]
MELSDAGDPYSRPARRTQWLVSALAYHYGLDRGVENEIVVLATGLDQYLQEIFHHLDWEGEGKIPGEDFRTLCQVLGLPDGHKEGEAAADLEECAGLCENLSADLTFRQFHARLCGYFSTKAGCQAQGQGMGVARLPVGKESEHIETQIRLRSPLRRRREKAAAGRRKGGRSSSRARGAAASPPPSPLLPGSCSRECYEEIVALEQAEDRIVKLEEENASLRELVEDMRAALQSSDARCLALQMKNLLKRTTLQALLEMESEETLWTSSGRLFHIVGPVTKKAIEQAKGIQLAEDKVGLWKSHANHKKNGTCFIHNRRLLTHSQSQTSKCLQSVLKEVELLRSSRDGQIEEAIRFNQELEKELRSSQEAVVTLEDSNRNLKREQAEMRKKVEEARQAVLNSLGKVKQLEAKASEVPHLQIYIQQLESELQYYR